MGSSQKIQTWINAATLGILMSVFGCADEQGLEADMANENFGIWCGDHACAWRVEEGRVEPAPTWHRKAMGIGLEGNPTVISQVVAVEDVHCLILSVQGDLKGDAAFFFEVDFNNDGLDSDDASEAVGDMNWETVNSEVGVPPDTRDLRIILRKTGDGEAVLASARLASNDYCAANAHPSATDPASNCDADAGVCAK